MTGGHSKVPSTKETPMKMALFADRQLTDYLAERNLSIASIVEHCPNPRIPSIDTPGAAEQLVKDFTISVPVLGDPKRPPRVTDRASQGLTVEIEVPFDGHGDLFYMRPLGSVTSTVSRAEVRQKALVFEYKSLERNADAVRARLEGDLSGVRQILDSFVADIRRHNESVPALVEQAFARRRHQLAGTNTFAETLFARK